MPFPEYIATRTLSAGGAATIESNRQLKIRATLQSTKSLVWSDTGFQFLQWKDVKVSALGTEVTFNPPRTDLAGWKDYDTKAVIDVSAEGSFSHRYLLLIEYLDENDAPIGIPPQNLGPFALPDGVGTYDVDKSVVVGTVAGDQVSIPDLWSQLVADAEAAAAAAQAAIVDSAEFVGAQISTPGTPARVSLETTIGAVVAPAVAPVSARVTTTERLIRVGGGSPPVDKQTAVIVGDSIISQNSSQYNTAGATQRVNNAAGWFNHAQVLLGHRFRLLKNAGMSGQTSAQILARFAADVTALAPGFAIFGGPTNDVTAIATSSLTFTQVKDNYEDMWDACDAAGIRVIQCVATPRNATSGAAHRAALFQVNQWLREQARNRPKFVLIDWYAELASGTLVDWKTGYIAGTDASGLHPNPRGAYEMGRIFAERVAPLTAAVDILPNSESELANLVNVTTGAALAKGATGIVGTGGTGQVATGWRVDPLPTASFVASKVARTDGLPGEWQQVTVNSGTVKIGVNVTGYGSTYTENDEIYAVAEYQLDPGMTAGNGKYVRLNLIAMKPDFGVGRQSIDMDVPSVVESAGSDYFPSSGVMVTPPVVVPNTATLRMALQFEVNGAATVRVGRIGMYKVGTGPGSDAWARSDAPLS